MVQESLYVRVRVQTESKKEMVRNVNGLWNIAIRERAERGIANKRVREVLAQALHIKPKSLRLVKGATSPSKTYLLINYHKP